MLRANDVIVAVDGKQVKLADDAIADIRAHRPGDKVELRVVRGSEPARTVETSVKAGSDGRPRLGGERASPGMNRCPYRLDASPWANDTVSVSDRKGGDQ